MNVVLVHPVHGAKIAMCDAEIEQDEKEGWTRYNEPTPVEAAPVVDKPVRNKLTRKVTPQQPVEQPNEVPSFLTSASDESEGN